MDNLTPARIMKYLIGLTDELQTFLSAANIVIDDLNNAVKDEIPNAVEFQTKAQTMAIALAKNRIDIIDDLMVELLSQTVKK